MRGSLKKRGKYWYAIVDIKTGNSKRKQKWINTKCERKSDAEKVLRDILTKVDKHQLILSEKITFTQLLMDWLNHVIVNSVEETTWESYELVITKHIIPYFRSQLHDILLQDLQPVHLQKYYDEKYRGNKNEKGLSSNTLRKHHANIKKALDHAVRMNLISINPADKVVLPKKEAYRTNYYTVEQLQKLFDICLGTNIESAVYIAAHYGLRRGEILGLKWDAIDFNQGTIIIKETRVKYGRNIVTKGPKSESSFRILPLMSNIRSYLKEVILKQKHKKLFYGSNYNDLGYVCCLDDGSPLKVEYLSRKFKEILKKNNMPHIRFHDLRHSIASYLLKHGVSLKDIQVWLGHSDLSTTANIYAHIDMEMKHETAKMINNIFAKVRI
ncbi:tyrosine-type recombinase/integrase [Aneurinibacillus aneurinilyticus]|nr:site-specific integrase [Aneurinibacillus aneurinilyticus]MED0705278.1 site-specific integrase [Aneurinibacillus aneurinilyticus]MED0722474.1 site-specific integrase [Aneurinibacillus aneurinilyticus]MED0733784.1 site-specific integrase [Aneurinibacillus aneurinilyticus]MED0739695.1 site-specific integrase [Aneurinibacillus aneurinilyticus]